MCLPCELERKNDKHEDNFVQPINNAAKCYQRE